MGQNGVLDPESPLPKVDPRLEVELGYSRLELRDLNLSDRQDLHLSETDRVDVRSQVSQSGRG